MNKFQLYVGDEVNTVSLWVRGEEKEYPIYANTRGEKQWYSYNTDVSTEPTELSEAFIEHLAHFYQAINGHYDGHTETVQDRPTSDPEWYEVEILNAINSPDITPEQEELLEWAYLMEREG